MRSWGDGPGGGEPEEDKDTAEPPTKKKRGEPAQAKVVQAKPIGDLKPPAKPVSRWTEGLKFEEQLEDFMKMPRRGMYNRYLVIGKLPPELRTSEAIWRMVAPVQRDIVQVEMLTCFGKPVAHVALRNATGAATMHRLAEQLLPNLTVAFAPPRRASSSLWLGNIDDFVNRKDLESLLNQFGRVREGGLRYVPSRTCAFVTFSEAEEAVSARNTLYGLEILRNQYLNVDFTDENTEPPEGFGMWGAGAGAPWGAGAPGRNPWYPTQPWADPRWGMYENWYREQQKRTGRDDMRAPQQLRERNRSRTPRRRREASPERERGRRRQREPSPVKQQESSPEPPQVPKVNVKLYKMGESVCNITANYVKGHDSPAPLGGKLHIDQRTKIDHCRSHMERAGDLATVWHFSAAERKDCPAYDALCDYFVDKQRVGLVQTPTHYVYIVPPTETYLSELKLPSSNFVVGLQIPIKKT